MAYQRVSPLQIGELWAVAITLRIALIEHLTPLTQAIASSRRNREAGDRLADALLKLAVQADTQPNDLVQMLAHELGTAENYDRAFIVQLIQRLRDQDPDVRTAFDWLEQRLQAFHGTSTQQVVQLEIHRGGPGTVATSSRACECWRPRL